MRDVNLVRRLVRLLRPTSSSSIVICHHEESWRWSWKLIFYDLYQSSSRDIDDLFVVTLTHHIKISHWMIWVWRYHVVKNRSQSERFRSIRMRWYIIIFKFVFSQPKKRYDIRDSDYRDSNRHSMKKAIVFW